MRRCYTLRYFYGLLFIAVAIQLHSTDCNLLSTLFAVLAVVLLGSLLKEKLKL